jgi:hypothetical protein
MALPIAIQQRFVEPIEDMVAMSSSTDVPLRLTSVCASGGAGTKMRSQTRLYANERSLTRV